MDVSFSGIPIRITESATMIRLFILLWIASWISLDRFVVTSFKYDLVLRFMAIRSSDAFHMETPNTKIRITDSNPTCTLLMRGLDSSGRICLLCCMIA